MGKTRTQETWTYEVGKSSYYYNFVLIYVNLANKLPSTRLLTVPVSTLFAITQVWRQMYTFCAGSYFKLANNMCEHFENGHANIFNTFPYYMLFILRQSIFYVYTGHWEWKPHILTWSGKGQCQKCLGTQPF